MSSELVYAEEGLYPKRVGILGLAACMSECRSDLAIPFNSPHGF